MPKKGQTVARPETLLRRLASTAKSDAIRLRAIELILFLEGRLELSQHSPAKKSTKADALNSLIPLQTVESTPNGQKATFHYDTLETELLSAAR